MTWIEQIVLNKRREVIVTFCTAATVTSFNANTQRVGLKLLWLHPGGIENSAANEECRVTIPGKNNTGIALDLSIMTISKNKLTDEMYSEVYGYLPQQQIKVDNASAISDAVLIEVLLR